MKTHLLRFTFVVLLFQLCSTTKAQWVTIPDPNFALYLRQTFPACMNGNLMDTTCSGVINATGIYCSNGNISSLSGIQYFHRLKVLNCEHNQITSLAGLPDSITYANCDYNQINTIPSIPPMMQDIGLYRNNLTQLPALPASLTQLLCSFNHLTSLPALPVGLKYLYCDSNLLTSLPVLRDSLMYLIANNNQFTTLPVLPQHIDRIYCAGNLLSSLPALPQSLKTLDVERNHLTTLPVLPDSLTYLNAGNNLISVFPVLPSALLNFHCNDNLLSTFPVLPAGLLALYCARNTQISALPTPLPQQLSYLDCSGNNITQLPSLPSTLTMLYCKNTPITVLPPLPTGLSILEFDSCNVSILPALSNSVMGVSAEYNPLVQITNFPRWMQYFSCRNCPSLTCLPKIDTIYSFNIMGSGIHCLPNRGTITMCDWPLLNFMPLCDMYNSNGCPVHWNIAGTTYKESNSNCSLDTLELPLPNIPIKIYRNGTLMQTVSGGNDGLFSYDADIPTTCQLVADIANTPFSFSCPSNGILNDTLTYLDSLHNDRNFGFECRTGYDIGVLSTVGEAHPARLTNIEVFASDLARFYNTSCTNGISGTVTMVINGPLSIISGTNGTNQAAITGNTLVWIIPDFGALSTAYFNVTILTDTFPPTGSVVCVTTTINAGSNDYNPANNTSTFCFDVTSSFDPNEKEVYPAGNIDTAQEWLTYTIRFQNTGAAQAFHIYIDDSLDTDLDPATFQLLAYSHQPQVQLKGRKVRFNFPNINLPDSNTNEPASHGYVQYKVKLKDNLPLGTQISNTAFIYFDFNAPVVTNTTTSTIALNTGITDVNDREPEIRIYPNPANTSLTVVVDESMVGSQLMITDLTGRKITSASINTQYVTLNSNEWPSGIYVVNISNSKQTATQKLVVSH